MLSAEPLCLWPSPGLRDDDAFDGGEERFGCDKSGLWNSGLAVLLNVEDSPSCSMDGNTGSWNDRYDGALLFDAEKLSGLVGIMDGSGGGGELIMGIDMVSVGEPHALPASDESTSRLRMEKDEFLRPCP